MKEKIIEMALGQQEETVALRRDFHRHAEWGWTEFRTASIVAKFLEDLGYEVLVGEDAMTDSRMGVPGEEVLNLHIERAKAQGAVTKYLDKMKGGKTAVVGILKTGRPGPVVGVRFDIDSNELEESSDENHRPKKEGFTSINVGAMHGCGHDGHTAMGISLAKVLAQVKENLTGTIKLFFQPAEEMVCGGQPMVEKGLVDDVSTMLGIHLGFSDNGSGELICGSEGFLYIHRFEVIFTGTSAHAGAVPEGVKSALLAASSAVLSLQGLRRHSKGASRILCRSLQGGVERAVLKFDTRGVSQQTSAFMEEEALRIVKATALLYDVNVEIIRVGAAVSAKSDAELAALVKETAAETNMFTAIKEAEQQYFSEDYSYFMERVQQNGGKATHIMLGANIAGDFHNGLFDFDESMLSNGVALLALLVYKVVRGMSC